jgi:DNA-binding NtrC family response regulator
MTIEKSFQIAMDVANEAPPATPVAPAASSPASEPDESAQPERVALAASLVAESLKLVHTIAIGRDPYTADPACRHKPENNPDTVKALCVITAFLAEQIGLNKHSSVGPAMSESRGSLSLDDYLHEIEHREILLALKVAKNNKTEAARVLGITFRALRYKLEQHGIE